MFSKMINTTKYSTEAQPAMYPNPFHFRITQNQNLSQMRRSLSPEVSSIEDEALPQ